MSSPAIETRVEEYWDWFAVALFILITVDMITTMFATWHIGTAAEANPLLRWALGEGLLTVTLFNLAATVIAVSGFYLLIEQLKATSAPYDRYLSLGLEVWLGLLIAGGLFVFANNLSVLFHGQTLLLHV